MNAKTYKIKFENAYGEVNVFTLLATTRYNALIQFGKAYYSDYTHFISIEEIV